MQIRTAEDNSIVTIKVIGVGGGGGNAVNNMVEKNLSGVEFLAANTDMQAMETSRADVCLQLGPGITKGMGAGADPEVGREAALESANELEEKLSGADMVFITAGMGGGTGTGAAPEVARISKESGALTVAVVTKPFYFEAGKRMKNAEMGWARLKEYADAIITIPNDRLLSLMSKNSTMVDMLAMVDDVLYQAVRGITDLIKGQGLINVDFADLTAVMQEVGPAIMGTGTAAGENRASEAAKRAIENQLLEDVGIDGARAVLVNVSGSVSLTLHEFQEACALIQEKAHPEANIIPGMLTDDSLGDDLRVTVIATGITSTEEEEQDTLTPMEALRNHRAGQKKGAKKEPQPLFASEVISDQSTGRTTPLANSNPGITPLPTPVFDEYDQNDYTEPAYLRKKAN